MMTATEPFLLPKKKKLKTKSVRIFHPGDFGFLSYLLLCACFLSTPASSRHSLINGKRTKLLWPHSRSKTEQTPIPVRTISYYSSYQLKCRNLLLFTKKSKRTKKNNLKKENIFLALVVLNFFSGLYLQFFFGSLKFSSFLCISILIFVFQSLISISSSPTSNLRTYLKKTQENTTYFE